MKQLPLSLAIREDATFANFVAGDNAALLVTLRELISNRAETTLYLWGQAGCGASHLLQAACHFATSRHLSCTYLPLAELKHYSTEAFLGLEHLDVVCLDNIEAIVGLKAWEEALFHLYNRLQDSRTALVLAAQGAPKSIGVQLPDLESRLTWGLVYQLQPLSDEDKIKVLQQRAASRGLQLSEQVGRYLLRRCQRNMNALFLILEQLDQASLAAQRPLTVPFVKKILYPQGESQ